MAFASDKDDDQVIVTVQIVTRCFMFMLSYVWSARSTLHDLDFSAPLDNRLLGRSMYGHVFIFYSLLSGTSTIHMFIVQP